MAGRFSKLEVSTQEERGALDVFNFVVTEGRVADADRYSAHLRSMGVPVTELQKLRVKVAEVHGTRRGVLEVRNNLLSLALRPLSPAPSEITVDANPVRDERSDHHHFGPDVGWQQATLARVQAQERLLIDGAGRVISAVMHPLLVVEPGRVHVSTHPDSPSSIPLEGILEHLSHHGAEVVLEPRGFDRMSLMDREVWVICPIYGARLVDTWVEYGTRRPARLLFERGGVPSHREINEARRAAAKPV